MSLPLTKLYMSKQSFLFETPETSLISPFTFGMSVCIFLARKEAFVIIFLAMTGVEACWLDDVEIWLGLEFEARFLMALLSSNTFVDPDNEALMWIISTIRLVSSWKRSKWILSNQWNLYLILPSWPTVAFLNQEVQWYAKIIYGSEFHQYQPPNEIPRFNYLRYSFLARSFPEW